MNDINYLQYSNPSLAELTKKINDEYYLPISILCGEATMLIREREQKGINEEVLKCKAILDAIEQYIHTRSWVFVPYLEDLMQKKDGGHNCIACTGICELKHSEKLIGFKVQLMQLNERAYSRMNSLLRAFDPKDDAQLIRLHDKLILIHSSVGALLHSEEHYLLPKIEAAQKSINAGGGA